MEQLEGTIRKLLDSKLEELDCFLVEVKYLPNKRKIVVYIDTDEGVSVNTCAEINRYLRFHLNYSETGGDYDLEVSSPGMDNPFKVRRQYEKNRGAHVEVVLYSGIKKKGILLDISEDGLTLNEEKRVNGKKAARNKPPEYKKVAIPFEDIKSTKKIIRF